MSHMVDLTTPSPKNTKKASLTRDSEGRAQAAAVASAHLAMGATLGGIPNVCCTTRGDEIAAQMVTGIV